MDTAEKLWTRRAHWHILLPAVIALFAAPRTVAQGVQELRSTCDVPPPVTTDLVCAWTADCSKAGCTEKCIANSDNLGFAETLSDYSFSETAYEMCPIVAALIRSISGSLGTALTSTEEPSTDEASASAPTSLLSRGTSHDRDVLAGVQRQSLLKLLLGQQNALLPPQVYSRRRLMQETSTALKELSRSPGRQLKQFLSTSDSASGPIPDDLTLECPTSSDLSSAAPALIEMGEFVEAVLTADVQGQLTEANRTEYDHIVDAGNMWRVLVPYFKDPERLEEYITATCAAADLVYPSTVFYSLWTPRAQDAQSLPDLQEGDAVRVCADTIDAFPNFISRVQEMLALCDVPFQASPNCYPEAAWFMPSGAACSTAQAVAHNVSSVPLQDASSVIESIHNACSSVTVQADCESAKAPEQMAQLDELRKGFLYKAPLAVDAQSDDIGAVSAATETPDDSPPPPGVISSGAPIANAGPAPGAPIGGFSPETSGAANSATTGTLGNSGLGEILALPSDEDEVNAEDLQRSRSAPLAPSLPHAMYIAALVLFVAAGAGFS